MTFLNGYLLGGLLLAGVPVLLHLIMRQKPKRLIFPAFRFLHQKHLSTQRRLRLQHLLLLALRILVIAALCLALSRPRVRSDSVNLGGEKAVAAVLVFDTSMSMGYTLAGQSRLDEARTRAREFLAEAAEGSQLAILDTGDDAATGDGVDRFTDNRPALNGRLDALRLRAANAPLNRQLERAVQMLRRLADDGDPPPRFLFVFSDRTRACWDAAPQRSLPLDGVHVVFVDVGRDETQDLAVDDVIVEPPAAAPGTPLRIRVGVHAAGADFENVLRLKLDNEPDLTRAPDEKPIKRTKGQSDEVVFERIAPSKPGVYQLTVNLVNPDALVFNNSRHATFVVRERPKVLALADDPEAARIWRVALLAKHAFDPVVKPVAQADEMTADALAAYKVVWLFQVSKPSPTLWAKLEAYVKAGGGLVVVPGGQEMEAGLPNYDVDPAKELLPGAFRERVVLPPDKPHMLWAPFEAGHELTAPFREWRRTTAGLDFFSSELQPFVNVYWEVTPDKFAVANYVDGAKHPPALLVRPHGQGQTVQLTSTLDERQLNDDLLRKWNNVWESSFGLVLVDRICTYLAGATLTPEVNFLCGQPVLLPLPPGMAGPFVLRGPESAAEGAATIDDGRIRVVKVTEPGNYTVRDAAGEVVAAGFSLAVRREESDLTRVPVEEIEAVLGKDAVLKVGPAASLKDAITGRWTPPLELLPFLMMIVLLALTVESLLANKFYRGAAQVGAVASERPPT